MGPKLHVLHLTCAWLTRSKGGGGGKMEEGEGASGKARSGWLGKLLYLCRRAAVANVARMKTNKVCNVQWKMAACSFANMAKRGGGGKGRFYCNLGRFKARFSPAIFPSCRIFKLPSLADKLDQSRVSCFPLSLCFPSLFPRFSRALSLSDFLASIAGFDNLWGRQALPKTGQLCRLR